MSSLKVIIPYFQAKPGLLRRALVSVFEQVDVPIFVVHVVDDESPLPAETEIAGLPAQWLSSIRVMKQRNAGPSVARNLALQSLDTDTEYVAFLDSDDKWRPHHLRSALQALTQGRAIQDQANFYFCNRWIEEESISGLDWRRDKFFPELLALPAPQDTFLIKDGFFRTIMSSLVHTSGVVYRFGPHREKRFDTSLHRAEDYQFFLSIVTEDRGAVLCTEPGFDVGRGISISRTDWGTVANLKASSDLPKALRSMLALPGLLPEEREEISQRLRSIVTDLATEVLHSLRRGRLPICLRVVLDNPSVAPAMARVLFDLRKRTQAGAA